MSKARIQTGSKRLADKIHRKLEAMTPEKAEHGTYAHARSTEDSPTFIRYIVTTGIRPFDDLVGGMPVGKSTELCGLPQSGKTNMAVRTCIRAQQGFIFERIQAGDGTVTLRQLKPGEYNVTILYYDNEGSLSDFTMRQVDGVVMDGEIIQCETIELLWKTLDGVMEELDKEQAETDVIQFLICVIDTIGSMTTREELNVEWGKVDYPRIPRQVKEGFRAMTARMQRENVMLIGLNHVSRKMTLRGPVAFKNWEYDSPGGKAFAYFATFQIFFEKLNTKYSLRGKGGEADGYIVYFIAGKNRIRPPLRQGRMALLFGIKNLESGKLIREGGFKDAWSMLEMLICCKAAKVNRETGSVLFYFSKFNIATTTFEAAEKTGSLEEQDDNAPPARTRQAEPDARGKKRRDPRISRRCDWPEFLQQHAADVEALYKTVIDIKMLAAESVALPVEDDLDENDTDEDDDKD